MTGRRAHHPRGPAPWSPTQPLGAPTASSGQGLRPGYREPQEPVSRLCPQHTGPTLTLQPPGPKSHLYIWHPGQGQCETTLSILLHPGSIKRDEQTRKRWVGQDKGLKLDRLTRWPPKETVSSRVLGTADLGYL